MENDGHFRFLTGKPFDFRLGFPFVFVFFLVNRNRSTFLAEKPKTDGGHLHFRLTIDNTGCTTTLHGDSDTFVLYPLFSSPSHAVTGAVIVTFLSSNFRSFLSPKLTSIKPRPTPRF